MIKVVEVQLEKGRFENFHVGCDGNKFMELEGISGKEAKEAQRRSRGGIGN